MSEQLNHNRFNLNWILGIILALTVAGIILLPKEKIKMKDFKVENREEVETKTENRPDGIISPEKNH